MLCKDCPHFHIEYMPLKSGGCCWDLGRAHCDKYKMIVEFLSMSKINKLKCAKESSKVST